MFVSLRIRVKSVGSRTIVIASPPSAPTTTLDYFLRAGSLVSARWPCEPRRSPRPSAASPPRRRQCYSTLRQTRGFSVSALRAAIILCRYSPAWFKRRDSSISASTEGAHRNRIAAAARALLHIPIEVILRQLEVRLQTQRLALIADRLVPLPQGAVGRTDVRVRFKRIGIELQRMARRCDRLRILRLPVLHERDD